MENNNFIKGIKFAFFAALISGAANFLNKEIITSGVDPILLTAVKNGIVGMIFVAVMPFLFRSKKISFNQIKKTDWLKFIIIAIVGGSFAFILFFKGLAISSAATGSFIHKTMFFWAAILAAIFLKEKVGRYQLLALAIMLGGALSLIKFKIIFLGTGELMILAATLLWSFEAVLVKKFVANIDNRLLAAARMTLGAIIIFIFVFYSTGLAPFYNLSGADFFKILIVSGFLFGYVFFWYRALSLLPVGLTTSVLTLAFPITLLVSNFKYFSLPKSLDLTFIFWTIAGVLLYIWIYYKKQCWIKIQN